MFAPGFYFIYLTLFFKVKLMILQVAVIAPQQTLGVLLDFGLVEFVTTECHGQNTICAWYAGRKCKVN